MRLAITTRVFRPVLLSPMERRERLGRRAVFGFLLLTSFGAGVVLSIVGPTAPAIATRLRVPEADLGVLFTASFLAATLATVACGALYTRFSGRALIPIALGAMALGLVDEGILTTLPLMAVGAVLTGTGIGIINVYVNATATRLFPERRETTLTLLGICFGVGAFITPLAAGLSLTGSGGYTRVYVGGAVALALPILPLLRGLGASHPPAARPSSRRAGLLTLLRDRNLRLLMALAGLYMGAQIGFGGWVVSIIAAMTHLPAARVAVADSAFWLCQAVGGALTVLLLQRGASPRRLIILGSFGAAGGSLALLALGHSAPFAVLCCALVGLAFAPILPLTMALAASGDANGSDGPRLAALFTTGQLGAAIIPPLQGALLATSTALPLWLTAACALGMVALAARVSIARHAA